MGRITRLGAVVSLPLLVAVIVGASVGPTRGGESAARLTVLAPDIGKRWAAIPPEAVRLALAPDIGKRWALIPPAAARLTVLAPAIGKRWAAIPPEAVRLALAPDIGKRWA